MVGDFAHPESFLAKQFTSANTFYSTIQCQRMRLAQIIIPAGEREHIQSILDDNDLEYITTEEVGDRKYTSIIYVPLPTGTVEDVLDQIRETSLGEQAFTVVLDVEAVVSQEFEQLQEEQMDEITLNRIARDEIRTNAQELSPARSTFLTLTAISAIIATAGLILDSPAVVVGSMVIAPLIGPAMATSVGSVIDDTDLFRRGVKLQLLGLGVAVVSAAAFASLLRMINLVPGGPSLLSISQISTRLTPDVLSLAIALGAGVAGAVSLSTGVSAAIVGVMIAAALVPPIGVVGIGIAWGLPSIIVPSGVLVIVNTISINATALITFWFKGYRPEQWFELDKARTLTFRRIGTLLIVILVLSAFLGSVTLASIQTSSVEESARHETRSLFASGSYQQFTLLDVSVKQERNIIQSPKRAIITVGYSVGHPRSSLAPTIERRIETATGSDITVEVRFIEIETADT